jgi:AraC family transcriptional regulator of adaptative response/methylated-DNA-[protein]-cysteine methyltransferase
MDPETATVGANRDFARVEAAIGFLQANFRDQPALDEIAAAANLSPYHFQRLFTRWAGVSPKQFLQCLTVEHAKRSLAAADDVLDAAFDAGLSGPGRLHDLFVTLEAVTPGEYKAMGEGIEVRYGFHAGPFGDFVLATTDRGICGLAFFRDGGAEEALADVRTRLPGARFSLATTETAPIAAALFTAPAGRAGPLRLWARGTNFQVTVWRALLALAPGQLTSYRAIAQSIGRPSAARAVGGAVAANPIGYLIPCHRVIRATSLFDTGYRWGPARKLAMIGMEAVREGAVGETA